MGTVRTQRRNILQIKQCMAARCVCHNMYHLVISDCSNASTDCTPAACSKGSSGCNGKSSWRVSSAKSHVVSSVTIFFSPAYSDVEFILPRRGGGNKSARRIYAARRLLSRVDYFHASKWLSYSVVINEVYRIPSVRLGLFWRIYRPNFSRSRQRK